MGILKDVRRRAEFDSAHRRAQEASLYAEVMEELERGERDKGLWGKALAKADGDETKATAKYIELRVGALADILNIGANIRDALNEAAPEAQLRKLEAKKRIVDNANKIVTGIWLFVGIWLVVIVGIFVIALLA